MGVGGRGVKPITVRGGSGSGKSFTTGKIVKLLLISLRSHRNEVDPVYFLPFASLSGGWQL